MWCGDNQHPGIVAPSPPALRTPPPHPSAPVPVLSGTIRPQPLQGGAGTVYEGLTYRLSFKFTSDYPVRCNCQLVYSVRRVLCCAAFALPGGLRSSKWGLM